MPRALRCDVAEHLYLALNRGNQRDTIFDKDGDFEAFLTVSQGQRDGRARLALVKEICRLADRSCARPAQGRIGATPPSLSRSGEGDL